LVVDDAGMSTRRVVLVVTCVIVAVLATVLVGLTWDQANKVATSVSALAAVAAVGVGVWTALSSAPVRIRVVRSGRTVSGAKGKAVSGVRAPADGVRERIDVERSGKSDASTGGHAVSGVDLTD
jgi:hypothetical protein